eukprot:5366062-Pleurochrysis_carterae.AAC.2
MANHATSTACCDVSIRASSHRYLRSKRANTRFRTWLQALLVCSEELRNKLPRAVRQQEMIDKAQVFRERGGEQLIYTGAAVRRERQLEATSLELLLNPIRGGAAMG